MSKMTLKQRRRHRELGDQLAALKNDPYLMVPADYEVGKDSEEDEKYQATALRLQDIVEEMHKIEEIGRRGH